MTKTKKSKHIGCYVKKSPKLSFSIGNAKISKATAIFALPAGHTCPFAKECLSKANMLTGKVVDGKHCAFRCYAATEEARYSSVRRIRWNNYNILKQALTIEKMGKIIHDSIPKGFTSIRIHTSGDYYSEHYFIAWLNVALNNPHITFYGYTKAIPFLIKYKKLIPSNLKLTASFGGTHDHLIKKHKLKYAKVVFSVEEAQSLGLPIDHDDNHAIYSDKPFALLIHGTQPAGTKASKAWQAIVKSGIGGYSKDKLRGSGKPILIPFKVFVNKNSAPKKSLLTSATS